MERKFSTNLRKEVSQLSHDIANFAWDFDPYDFGDNYADKITAYAWNTRVDILDNEASYIREFLQEAIIASEGHTQLASRAQTLLQRFDEAERKILFEQENQS